VLAIELGNILRIIALLEILFCLGFLCQRLWVRRHNPWQYLSLMAVALVLYSVFAALIVIYRFGEPLSWRTPLVIVAATVSFIAIIKEGVHK
jgi:drug/metabolite transporter superfamily protein YnfA